jgi:hypothetical protein
VNCESEILRKKYICESNTVNDMKLMILEKIRVIRTCSSSPRAASVNDGGFLCLSIEDKNEWERSSKSYIACGD